ncbi:Serine/threonine/tyrosine-interacting protein [Pelomyxa schiedti]|nr:Serine/threonine/tyrosine-interacting protein [Pelomyxa schiedti]
MSFSPLVGPSSNDANSARAGFTLTHRDNPTNATPTIDTNHFTYGAVIDYGEDDDDNNDNNTTLTNRLNIKDRNICNNSSSSITRDNNDNTNNNNNNDNDLGRSPSSLASMPAGSQIVVVPSSYFPPLRPEPDQILDRLYLGGQSDAYNPATIARLGVTHVLTVAIVEDFYKYRSCFPPTIQCMVVSVFDQDNENIVQYFPRTNAFIDHGRANGVVLVHCVWGISRSAAFVIAYVMHHRRIDFHSALEFVRQARPIVRPNLGFRKQLAEYGKDIVLAQFSIRYVTSFGQELYIVGSIPILGMWHPTPDNKMKWGEGNVWSISLPVLNQKFEYKYVMVDVDGHLIWESSPNRLFDGSKRFIRDYWNCW